MPSAPTASDVVVAMHGVSRRFGDFDALKSIEIGRAHV